jgi:hypothetical protein
MQVMSSMLHNLTHCDCQCQSACYPCRFMMYFNAERLVVALEAVSELTMASWKLRCANAIILCFIAVEECSEEVFSMPLHFPIILLPTFVALGCICSLRISMRQESSLLRCECGSSLFCRGRRMFLRSLQHASPLPNYLVAYFRYFWSHG